MSAIRFAVLELLRLRGPVHGHALIRELHTMAPDSAPSPGALYGVINRLRGDGLISEENRTQVGRYPPRQEYANTPQGLVELERLWTELWDTPATSRNSIGLALSSAGPDRMSGLAGMLDARADLLQRSLGPARELRAGCSGSELAAHFRDSLQLGEVEWLRAAARGLSTCQ